MAQARTTRRVITGHDSVGKAVFTSDENLEPRNPLRDDGSSSENMVGFTNIHRTDAIPANSQSPVAEVHGKMISLVEPDSVTCRIVDFPPSDDSDKVNVMHRTQSLDYGIVLKGTIKCVLDDGAEKTVSEGDVVVQRATIHAWVNVSKENCRMLFVLVPSEPVKVGSTGEVLKPTDTSHLKSPSVNECLQKFYERFSQCCRASREGL